MWGRGPPPFIQIFHHVNFQFKIQHDVHKIVVFSVISLLIKSTLNGMPTADCALIKMEIGFKTSIEKWNWFQIRLEINLWWYFEQIAKSKEKIETKRKNKHETVNRPCDFIRLPKRSTFKTNCKIKNNCNFCTSYALLNASDPNPSVGVFPLFDSSIHNVPCFCAITVINLTHCCNLSAIVTPNRVIFRLVLCVALRFVSF